jgi:hypothetical protein
MSNALIEMKDMIKYARVAYNQEKIDKLHAMDGANERLKLFLSTLW